jgi:TonB family protein
MAAKHSPSIEIRPGEPQKGDPASIASDSVDALVSDFLAELTTFSSEMKQVQQPNSTEEIPAENKPLPGGKEAKIPLLFECEKVAPSVSRLDSEYYDNEIEESLVELERLKFKVVPIVDRKDSQPETLPDFSAAQERPDAAGLQLSIARDNSSASFTTEENALNVPEPLRTSTAPPRSNRRRVKIIFASAAVILVGILGYFFFLQSNRDSSISRPIEPVPKAEANESSDVAARSEGLGDKSIVSSPASEANKGGSIQPTRSIGTLPQMRGEAKSSLTTAAKANPGGRISVPDLISENRRERSVEVAKGSPEAKPGDPERPPRQTTDPGAGAGLAPPLAPSSSTVVPAVEAPTSQPPTSTVAPAADAAASRLPPNPIDPNTPAITTPGNASTAPPGPSTRESSREPAEAEPSRNADEGSVSAEPTRTGARVVAPIMAQPITRVQPTYPLIARMQRITGVVELEAETNEKGEVIRAKAVSGPRELRSAAEEAIMKWKFKPASINGINVRSTTRVSVNFTIK